MHIFATTDVGIVFPQHFAPLRESINWGRDYDIARRFLAECGITIDNGHLLEFPAGSMFWFRPQAVAPLLKRRLTFDDFPAESGQIDGTIAHAIERLFLYMAEAQGFKWLKVNAQVSATGDTPVLTATDDAALTDAVLRVWQPVLCK